MAFLLATNPVIADAARQVTGHQIANGTVTGKDVKNRSLKAKDLKAGVLTDDLAQLKRFAGPIPDVPPNVPYPFVFLGPAVAVQVGPDQAVVASGTATIGLDAGTNVVDVALCRIPDGAQAVNGPQPLGGVSGVSTGVAIGTGRTVVAASAAESGLGGTFYVGMCARSGTALNNNDTASGFVEVVDLDGDTITGP